MLLLKSSIPLNNINVLLVLPSLKLGQKPTKKSTQSSNKLPGRFEASENFDEFLKDMLERQNLIDDQRVLRSIDVNVLDLINAELFQAVRNRGMAALELGQKFDIMDTDGPMAKAAEYLTLGLAQVRRSRFIKSDDFRQLGINQKKVDIAEALKVKEAEFAQEARESVEGFMRFVKDQPNDDAAKAAAELFAKSDINDYGDIGAYLNSKFRRGDLVSMGRALLPLQGL